MSIEGLGPHGELATPADQLVITPAQTAATSDARYHVAIVLHTTSSDWSRQQVAGIVATLGACSAVVTEVVDCGFDKDIQIAALTRLADEKLDAIISIPIGNAAVADAHRQISRAGTKLLLMDNAPTGLLPGADYVSVVSADNFGLGRMCAELLSPHLATNGAAGILSFGVDFFATNEREIAFRQWMETERPDLTVRSTSFKEIARAGDTVIDFIEAHPDITGLFAVWDEPAIAVMAALKAVGQELPMTAVDLGNEVAIELARNGMIKGIGAQQPYAQGEVIARACILSLVGEQVPSWVVLPGIRVGPENVVESYQVVWHSVVPRELMLAQSNKTDAK